MSALVVRDMFDGKFPITAFEWNGRRAYLAKEVGQALGYSEEGAKLSNIIQDKWSAEFIPGTEYDVLDSRDVAKLRNLLASAPCDNDSAPGLAIPAKAQRATILYQSGLWLVIDKTEKPEGVAFRKWISRKVVPSIAATGSYSLPTKAVQPSLPVPPATGTKYDIEKLVTSIHVTSHEVTRLNGKVDRVDIRLSEVVDEVRAINAKVDRLAEIVFKMADMMGRPKSSPTADEFIGASGARFVLDALKTCASLEAPVDQPTKRASVRMRIEHSLRSHVGYCGRGRRWDLFPTADFPKLRLKVEDLLADSHRTMRALQGRLPGVS